jgi:Skp family chaperone for outer membrane proteins
MNKLLALLSLLAAAVLPAQAQLKVATVNFGQLYDGYYKVQEANKKFESSARQAGEEVKKMREDGMKLIEEMKKLEADAKSAELSADKKAGAEKEWNSKRDEVQKIEKDLREFIQNTNQMRNKEIFNHQARMVEEIKEAITKVAKAEGSELVFDVSGRSTVGMDERGQAVFGLETASRVTPDLPQVLYADAKFDITKKVSEDLNKDSKKTVEPTPGK